MEINNIFKKECTYNNINDISKIKMRHQKNGIQLNHALLYKFLYSKKEMTKERAISIINNVYNMSFTRQAYESKENNIPSQIYQNIYNKIQEYYVSKYTKKNNYKLVAVDGTYNNDVYMNEILNMGFYDITNNIPLDIASYGKENKNKEVSSTIDYISNNINKFKNTIIVGDRAYFTYEFMVFLKENNIKFIIRCKGDAKNLLPDTKIRSSLNNFKNIMKLRNNVRIIKYNNIIEKTVYDVTTKTNTKNEKYELKIENNCVICTNLLDKTLYTDIKILDMYRSRWDIEVFFKYIKCNYKFQHIKDKLDDNYKKMFICELIISFIIKIIEKYYFQKFANNIKHDTEFVKYKINKNNLVSGIYDSLIFNIICYNLTDDILNKFCKSYIKIIENKINRSFPRTSKTPFSKWYVKAYSNQTKYMRIIRAILDDDLINLDKNLKSIATKIININGKKYG